MCLRADCPVGHSRRGPYAGAPGTTRTCDLRFRKPLLYPLSYGGGGWQLGLQLAIGYERYRSSGITYQSTPQPAGEHKAAEARRD